MLHGIKENKQRLLAWLLVCAMAVLYVPGTVFAEQPGSEEQDVLLDGQNQEEIRNGEAEPEALPFAEESKETDKTEEPGIDGMPESTVDQEEPNTASPEPGETLQEESPRAVGQNVPGSTANGQIQTGWVTASNGKSWYGNEDGTYPAGEWKQIGNKLYHFDEEGYLHTGWYEDENGEVFYFKQTGAPGVKGVMFSGWQQINGKKYYFKASGVAGVKGKMWTGWLKHGGLIYFLEEEGEAGTAGQMAEGWTSVDDRVYYFMRSGTSRGKMLTGLQSIGGVRYYFKTTGTYGVRGQACGGWKEIDGKIYYFSPQGELGEIGQALTGWQKIGDERFYFMRSGTSKGKMLTGFNNISQVRYFFRKNGDFGEKGAVLTGWQSLDGKYYYFDKNGGMLKNTVVDGKKLGADGAALGVNTLKGFLQNALKPVGSTLYIWGGGHDDWNGGDGTRYGVNPKWKQFFNAKARNYDYNRYRFSYQSGLDCSGYVGWSVYNTAYRASGHGTCVTYSGDTPGLYARRGWGNSVSGTTSASFKPGDVVSWSGHVWIVLGKCSDGSYVIMQSTPQAGVQISGTVTKSGVENSEAVQLAKTYMKRYYPGCTSKLDMSYVASKSFLTGPGGEGLNRFRWDLSGGDLLSDPEGYAKKTAQQILSDLFAS